MAPQRVPRLGAPLPGSGVPPPGAGSTDLDRPAGSADSRQNRASRGVNGGREERGTGGRGDYEPEDIHGLVISAVRARFPGLNFCHADIDRAHRLPGQGHRVIVKFVRSGPGSARDRLMSRRTELKEFNDLFISESLTVEKQRIFLSLLDAKKQKRIHTVYRKWGHVFCKEQRIGVSTRATQ